jgi:hypothetical protein
MHWTESRAELFRPLIGSTAVKIRLKVPARLLRNENLSGVADDPLAEVEQGRFPGQIRE